MKQMRLNNRYDYDDDLVWRGDNKDECSIIPSFYGTIKVVLISIILFAIVYYSLEVYHDFGNELRKAIGYAEVAVEWKNNVMCYNVEKSARASEHKMGAPCDIAYKYLSMTPKSIAFKHTYEKFYEKYVTPIYNYSTIVLITVMMIITVVVIIVFYQSSNQIVFAMLAKMGGGGGGGGRIGKRRMRNRGNFRKNNNNDNYSVSEF